MHPAALRCALACALCCAAGCPSGASAIPCNVDDDCPSADVCFQGTCTAPTRVPHPGEGEGSVGEGEGSIGEGEGSVGEGEGSVSEGEGSIGEGEGALGEGEGSVGEGEGSVGEGEGEGEGSGGGEGEGEGGVGPVPLASWSFDSLLPGPGGTSIVVDDSGNGHDLVLSTAGSLVTGIDGNALSLDAQQHGQAASLPLSALGASSFSVAACFEATQNLNHFDMPFFFGGASVGQPGIDVEAGQFDWNVGISDGVTNYVAKVGDDTLTGSFHCYVGVVDRASETLRGYRDGMRVRDVAIPGFQALTQQQQFFEVGGEALDANPFDGAVDDIAVFDVALDDVGVGALHDRLVAPGLFARWSFDELDASSIARDVSGNGHDGVATSASIVDGFIEKGITFGAAGAGHVDVGVTADDFTQGSFSVHLCYDPPAQSTVVGQVLFASGSCALGSESLCVGYGNDSFETLVSDGAGRNCTLTAPAAAGAFHCTTVVVDRAAGACTEYVDGASASNDVTGGALGSIGSAPIVMGSFTGASGQSGVLDEVRLYTRPLAESEVAALPHP